MAKIKSRVSLLRAARHNTRERMPPNADPEKTRLNQTEGGSASDVMNRYTRLLPAKIRKNAVHAVEVFMTASPDFKGPWADYTRACRQWAADLFGPENVLHAAAHRDETTTHVHMLVMPIKDGKLNAKHFIGGSRDRLTELQNDFYETVGKPRGLERGLSKAETKARHTPHTLALKSAELEERRNAIETAEAVLKNKPGGETAVNVAKLIAGMEHGMQQQFVEKITSLSKQMKESARQQQNTQPAFHR